MEHPERKVLLKFKDGTSVTTVGVDPSRLMNALVAEAEAVRVSPKRLVFVEGLLVNVQELTCAVPGRLLSGGA